MALIHFFQMLPVWLGFASTPMAYGWAWFLGFWGIGTYGRNDEIDVRYEIDGRPMVATALEVMPPG